MLYQSHNPYSVLSETISFDNVQKIGELITLKTLRGCSSYSKYAAMLYLHYVNDLNRRNQATKIFLPLNNLPYISLKHIERGKLLRKLINAMQDGLKIIFSLLLEKCLSIK